MWDCTVQSLQGGRAIRYAPRQGRSPVRYREVLRLWRQDEGFRSYFISLLAGASFEGYRWETPPITLATADRDFEFVLLDAPGIDRMAEVRAFDEQFRAAGAGRQVVAFSNLGNDAVLVVPCPMGPPADYVHLAAFVRRAPAAQVHELWRVVGETMEARLDETPIWLSTAGMGVSWLHVRLDSRPKYYGFGEYRNA